MVLLHVARCTTSTVPPSAANRVMVVRKQGSMGGTGTAADRTLCTHSRGLQRAGLFATSAAAASTATPCALWRPSTRVRARGPQSPTACPQHATRQGEPVLDGKIYVVGGASTLMVKLPRHGRDEAYDPAANAWSQAPPMSSARHFPGVAVLNGKLYAAGGVYIEADEGSSSSLEVSEGGEMSTIVPGRRCTVG